MQRPESQSKDLIYCSEKMKYKKITDQKENQHEGHKKNSQRKQCVFLSFEGKKGLFS